MHSAEWNPKTDLKGKRVAIVGTGASAIQILPRLINDSDCKSVTLFQRTAPFVYPRDQQIYSDNFKELMGIYPFGIIYRWCQYLLRELLYVFVWKNYTGFCNRFMTGWFERLLANQIKEKTLRKKLTPNFRLGCKRVLFADDYYSSMNNEKFNLETEEILGLTGSGIKTTGSEHHLDIIIYATGFQLFHNTIEMKNLGKIPKNKDDIKSFYGVFLPNVPNYAMLIGPMSALGHNSMIFMIECQTQFIINVIREMFSRDQKQVTVTEKSVESFMAAWRLRVDNSVWAAKNCSSWYQQDSTKKRPWTIWPWSTIEYFFKTRKNQPDNFIFE
jgi:cation diffusion facilitator CzcD-associated flavoprotein CzcO